MGAEGLEASGQNAGETANSVICGPTSGPTACDLDSLASLKARSLDDLQRAWKSLRRLEDLADDPAESKAAERAVAFVDKAFAALEGGKR